VLPDEVAKGLKPRLVSKDEEEGATAMGRCCARVAGALFGGPGAEEEEEAAQDDVGRVAERLEVQRQALVDLEASILEAQKEVRAMLRSFYRTQQRNCWLASCIDGHADTHWLRCCFVSCCSTTFPSSASDKLSCGTSAVLCVQVLSGPDTGSFIVLFKTPAAATLAARSSVFPQSSNSLEAFKVQPAPSPEDMLWQVSEGAVHSQDCCACRALCRPCVSARYGNNYLQGWCARDGVYVS
jgi:hypothetical protein